MEKRNDPGNQGEEDGAKDLMKSTLIALGWEESPDDDPALPKDNVEAKMEALINEIASLKAEAVRKDDRIAELHASVEALERERDQAVSSLEAVKGELEVARHARVDAPERGAAVTDLEEKLSLQVAANEVLEQKCRALSGDVEAFQTKLQDSRTAGLAEKEEELVAVKEQLSSASQLIEGLEGTVREKDVAIEMAASKIEELQDEVADLKNQVVGIIEENAGFRGKLKDKDEQATTLQESIDKFKTQERALNAEMTKLQLAVDTLKAENEEQAFQIREYERVINSQKHELLQSVSDTSEGMGQLQQLIDEKDARIHDLEGKLDSSNGRYTSLMEKTELIEKDRFSTQAILDKANRELEEFREKFYLQKNIIKKLEFQIDDLKKTNEQLGSQAKQAGHLEDEIARLKESYDAEIRSMTAEVDKVIGESEALARALKEQEVIVKNAATLETTVKNQQALIERAERVSQENETEARSLKDKIRELEAKQQSLVSEREALTKEIATLGSKVSDLEIELEKVGNVDEELLKDAEKKEAYYQDKIDELEKALGEALENTMNLSSTETELDTLKSDVGRKNEEISALKKRVGELEPVEGIKITMEEEIKTLKVSLKEMRRRLGKYEQP